ncbi:MAG: hypothetical protein WD271_17635 [Acidimicrobiia bacterium]
MTTATRPVSTLLATAAAASAGAGLVHAAAAGNHADDPMLAWTFALCAVAQLAWAGFVVFRPNRPVVIAGVLLNAGCVAVWLLTHTVGLGGPFGTVEHVGFQDALAAGLAGIAVIGGTVSLVGERRVVRHLDIPAIAVACFLVLVLAVPAMAAGHTHSDATAAPAHTHSHPAATAETATGTIVSLNDPRLTSLQRERAKTLLDETRLAMAFFANEQAVVAAGYKSIGDGRRIGSFEHFVNSSYITDGRELDAHAIESIVLQHLADGSKRVVSAMYILNRGRTLAGAPDIAGTLTPWHDHQNLCWDDAGHVVGILVNGVCRPGGTFRGTSPMIHVWIENTPCGPFAGIEGHGGAGCDHSHTTS